MQKEMGRGTRQTTEMCRNLARGRLAGSCATVAQLQAKETARGQQEELVPVVEVVVAEENQTFIDNADVLMASVMPKTKKTAKGDMLQYDSTIARHLQKTRGLPQSKNTGYQTKYAGPRYKWLLGYVLDDGTIAAPYNEGLCNQDAKAYWDNKGQYLYMEGGLEISWSLMDLGVSYPVKFYGLTTDVTRNHRGSIKVLRPSDLEGIDYDGLSYVATPSCGLQSHRFEVHVDKPIPAVISDWLHWVANLRGGGVIPEYWTSPGKLGGKKMGITAYHKGAEMAENQRREYLESAELPTDNTSLCNWNRGFVDAEHKNINRDLRDGKNFRLEIRTVEFFHKTFIDIFGSAPTWEELCRLNTLVYLYLAPIVGCNETLIQWASWYLPRSEQAGIIRESEIPGTWLAVLTTNHNLRTNNVSVVYQGYKASTPEKALELGLVFMAANNFRDSDITLVVETSDGYKLTQLPPARTGWAKGLPDKPPYVYLLPGAYTRNCRSGFADPLRAAYFDSVSPWQVQQKSYTDITVDVSVIKEVTPVKDTDLLTNTEYTKIERTWWAEVQKQQKAKRLILATKPRDRKVNPHEDLPYGWVVDFKFNRRYRGEVQYKVAVLHPDKKTRDLVVDWYSAGKYLTLEMLELGVLESMGDTTTKPQNLKKSPHYLNRGLNQQYDKGKSKWYKPKVDTFDSPIDARLKEYDNVDKHWEKVVEPGCKNPNAFFSVLLVVRTDFALDANTLLPN